MLRGVLTVGGWTMASRLLGFLRDILIAALAGTGPIADAFFVANKLPNLFRRLFGEGAFNAAFVPEFSGLLAAEGPAAARRFAEEAISVLAFWLFALTLLGEIFMPAIMRVLAPGFAEIPAKFALATELTRITFPYLLLICLAAVLSGVLNGLNRFAAAAAAPLLFNAISIAAMLGLSPYVPTVGHALAWGVSVSGVVQLIMLVIAVRRAGMALRIPRPRLTPQMRLLLRRMAPGTRGRRGDAAQSGSGRHHWQSAATRHRLAALLRRARLSAATWDDRRGGGNGAAPGAVAAGARGRSGGRHRNPEPRHRIRALAHLAGGACPGRGRVSHHVHPVRPGRVRRPQRPSQRAIARRVCTRAAGLRAAESAGSGLLRPRRHVHAGQGRHGDARARISR